MLLARWRSVWLGCLGFLVAGCVDQWTGVDVTVRVPPEVQAAYSGETRGVVVGRLDAGSIDHVDLLGVLCEPSVDYVEIVQEMGGIGCRGEGTVWVWVDETEEDDAPPACDAEGGDPYNGPHVPPAGAPQATAAVFSGVDDRRCRGGEDAVTLTLAYP